MTAYYNEIDKKACAALRQLIAEGAIAPGFVDERSIKEVNADDLRNFTQWHFFAGAGIWSVAARAAGWPDSRPILTASCPCQPFSGSGKGLGVDDPRHLWPDLFRIIRAARAGGFLPPVLMGEQVSKAAGYGWFDGVRADLASEGIASATRDIPACAVDAPHERNRLYWIAVAQSDGRGQPGRLILGPGEGAGEDGQWSHGQSGGSDGSGSLVNTLGIGRREGWSESGVHGGRDTAADANVCQCGYPATPCDKTKHDYGHDCVEGNLGDANPCGEFQRQGNVPDVGGRSGDSDARGGNLDHAERAGRQGHAGDGDDQAGRRFADRHAATTDDAPSGRNGSWYATLNGSPATMEKRGAPNPVFPCWLMGWSDEVIFGALRGIQSLRSLPRKSSARSSTPKAKPLAPPPY